MAASVSRQNIKIMGLEETIMGQGNGAISIVRMDDIEWTSSGARSVAQQEIRYDTESGHYFGAVKFQPLVWSGIHRHVGPAVSYMVYGALFD